MTPQNPFEWPEYLFYLSLRPSLKPEPAGIKPVGARWGIWPLYLEEYRTDSEPRIEDGDKGTAPNRIVIWTRPTRTDTPRGWIKWPFGRSSLYIGYHELNNDYASKWHAHARHYRNQWIRGQKDKTHKIETLTYQQFADAFATSTVAQEIPTFELIKLRARLNEFPSSISIWGVRRVSDGTIIGGLTSFANKTTQATHYGCGFYLKEARKERPMIALMDHWFEDSVRKGLAVAHLGIFTLPSIASGRGKTISDFKAQFVTHYLRYQPPLFRFMRGKFFRS